MHIKIIINTIWLVSLIAELFSTCTAHISRAEKSLLFRILQIWREVIREHVFRVFFCGCTVYPLSDVCRHMFVIMITVERKLVSGWNFQHFLWIIKFRLSSNSSQIGPAYYYVFHEIFNKSSKLPGKFGLLMYFHLFQLKLVDGAVEIRILKPCYKHYILLEKCDYHRKMRKSAFPKIFQIFCM